MTSRSDAEYADALALLTRYNADRLKEQNRNKMIADAEAARVARGEPRQPPYVFPPDWEAYRARAAYLIAKSQRQ